jgi:Flp pilus assembly protein CpaB
MKIKHVGIWLLLSGISLLGSLGVGYIYVRSQLDVAEVWIAKRDLSPRTQITEDDLVRVEIPKALLTSDYYNQSKDIINMYVKIQHAIPRGSLIFRSALESLDESIDKPRLMLRSQQAMMSINVDIVKTAGKTIQAGQRIDIYGMIKQNRETIVGLLLENVRVLAILDKNGQEVTDNPKQLPKLMLLAIHQDYVSLLTKLITIGELSITTTAEFNVEEECVLNLESPLLGFLYVQ